MVRMHMQLLVCIHIDTYKHTYIQIYDMLLLVLDWLNKDSVQQCRQPVLLWGKFWGNFAFLPKSKVEFAHAHAHAHAHASFISTTTKPLPDSATNTDYDTPQLIYVMYVCIYIYL